MNYSVLMTVYEKDNPEYFAEAVNSILNQTVQTDDFVLVCDGKLSEELNQKVNSYSACLKIIRLDKNYGLGIALNCGLKHCKNDLIIRMDSDDISVPDRCEKQLAAFESNDRLDILSGTIQEFSGEMILNKRVLPKDNDEIISLSKKRSPFNHPAVMYRKSAVQSAGGYTEEYHFFEDYDLWVRMLRNGSIGANLDDTLLKMRVSDDMYKRRGGKEYAKDLLRFHNHLRKTGWISTGTFLSCAVPHSIICVMPNGIRRRIYGALRQKD